MRVYTGLDVWSDFGGRFPWKSRLIDVDHGIRMAVVDEGPRNAPLTFLLHSLTQNHNQYASKSLE